MAVNFSKAASTGRENPQPCDRRSKVKRAKETTRGDLQLRREGGGSGKQAIGMFDVLVPGKLVLTLRSTPPFLAESAFALALTILLAAPLIVRVYLLLDKPLRTTLTKTSRHRRRYDRANRSLLIHYPAPIKLADSTSSSSLHPESARRINSTPTLRGNSGISKNSSRRGIRRVDRKIGESGSKIRICPSSDRPSSLVDSQHPLIDISNLDYKAYRYKLIEATLRKQYDDFQPPGDVVLNSLHLNSADSVIGVRLNDRYDHSLFDFVEEYYDIGRDATSRRNAERLHPLDHFLSKGTRRPRTSEKETATISDDGIDRENSRNHLSSENVDGNSQKLPSVVDDNGNPCVRSPLNDVPAIATSNQDSRSEVPILRRSIPARSRKCDDKATLGHDAEDDCSRFAGPGRRKESSTKRNSDRPASAGNTCEIFTLSRAATSLERRWEATGSPPRPSRSRESKKKLEDYPLAALPLSGKRRAEREAGGRLNFISVSSASEIASIRSESSKRREDEMLSCRSRESSFSPRNRASSRPPWMTGNRRTSFNRKYGGNITEEISAARVARRPQRGSGLPGEKLTVSSRGQFRSRESSARNGSTSRNPALSSPKAASFVASAGKELIGMTSEQQRQQRGENFTTRPCGQQRSKSKDVGGVMVKDNEEERTLKITDSPPGEKMSAGRTAISTMADNAALSFLSSATRTPGRPGKRSSTPAAFFANAPVTESETWGTKEPELITSRSGTDAARERPVSGNNALRLDPESPSAVDRPVENRLKLNHGGGRRRLRSAENPSKGVSLSPQIELSAEVLNPADDTDDKSAIPDSGKFAGLTSRIDSRENTGTAAPGSDDIPRGRSARMGNGVKSNSANDIARSRMPKIMRNPRARSANVNGLSENLHGSAAVAAHPALRDANSETKSGLNGMKLNTRSNGTVDEMRYDESPSAEASSLAKDDNAGRRRGADEELQLPRHDSKIGLAMNSALKRYIKMLKQGLRDQGDKDGVALASLSLSDAVSILSEQRTSLSPEEIQELQTVLDRIERNPELLYKLSYSSTEIVA
ncbi:PREDICTED: uncharacterized protein LOC108751614 [Trachymyrmex septentrionalis]|uniref:uncharacterized protein LOC108751614 n=1 Tax=Trachymyrmex septentrionalis TaxID=34720 RepID=UPI00084F7A44|nr:PREDICTED: uncharacterized protein LOC108751614 [Trachymyrmex septentrionalis]